MTKEFLYAVIIMALTPLSAGGIYLIVDFIINRMKVRMGYVKILKITKNFRLKKMFAKPSGSKIKIEKDKSAPFTNKPPFMAFEGVVPVSIFTSKGEQLNLLKEKGKSKIDLDYISLLVTEAYNLGILSAIKQDSWMKILMLACIGASLLAVLLGYMNLQTLSKLTVGA